MATSPSSLCSHSLPAVLLWPWACSCLQVSILGQDTGVKGAGCWGSVTLGRLGSTCRAWNLWEVTRGLCAFPEELALCWGPPSRATLLGLTGRRAFCLRAPALAISPPSGVPKLPRDAACVGFPSVQTCPPSRFPARAQTPLLEALSPFLPLPFALAHSEDADWPFGKYGVFLPASPTVL